MRPPAIWMIRSWIEDFSAYDHFAQPLGFLRIAERLIRSGYQVYYIDALRSEEDITADPIGTGVEEKILTGYRHVPIQKPITFVDVPRIYRRFGDTEQNIMDRLQKLPDPAVVLMTSGMTYWFEGLERMMKAVRCLHPDVPVAIGGIYAGISTDHARDVFPGAAIFQGPADYVFYRWLTRLTGHFMDDQAVTEHIVPAWHLVPGLRYGVIETSRGCWNRCAYCFASGLNKGWSPVALESVRREIEFLVNTAHVRDIALYDDDLGCQTPQGLEHFTSFLQMLSVMSLPIRWHLPNALGIDSISPTIAGLMKETGIQQPRLSLNHIDRHLDENGLDDTALEAFQTASTCLLEAGYETTALSTYIVTGFPDQKLNWIRKAVEQLIKRNIKPYLAQFSPIPGTPIGDQRLAQLGFPFSRDLLLTNKILSVYRHPGWTADQYRLFVEELKKSRS